MAVFQLPAAQPDASLTLIWGHGWAQTHQQFLTLAQSTVALGTSWLVDFPGFGASPLPPGPWGTAEYADAVAGWLATQPRGRRIWVGHSFGGRVGLQLAARHPGLLDGLVLISSAGLPRKRSPREQLKFRLRGLAYKAARQILREGPGREWLRQRFGSADYVRAGPLRASLVKVVTEDLSAVARQVTCPVLLLYGDRDTETPAEIGQRLQALLPRAQFFLLRGYDHYTILTAGCHQVAFRLTQFAQELAQ